MIKSVEELEDAEDLELFDEEYVEYLANPESARPWREIRAELIQEGLLEDKKQDGLSPFEHD